MALYALQRGMRAGQGEARGRVIERRITPGCGGMALLAGLGEACLHVIGVSRPLEILQVAGDTRRVRARQVVVVVHVTLRTLHGCMRAGQREAGGRVVEGRPIPGRRVVALLAGLGEPRLYVIGIRGALEVLQVATGAGGIRAGQVVVIVHVTLHALHRCMRARQGETGGRMVEGRPIPGRRVVALLAGLGEPRLYVIGIRGALEVRQVATGTGGIRAGQVVVIVHVTLHALHRRMRAREGETGGRVVKVRPIPGSRAVALLAILGEAARHVIWIRGPLVILQVAGDAGRVRAV